MTLTEMSFVFAHMCHSSSQQCMIQQINEILRADLEPCILPST